MCYFCHAQLFETTHAENIKSPLVQHSCRNAKVVEAFCDANCPPSTRCRASLHAHMHVVSLCRCAYDRRQRSHPISIAVAASQSPTSRDFVPWRFLVAGRINVRSVSPSRRPKTLYGTYRCQIKGRHACESFCHVRRLHCGMAAPLLGCAERSSPEAACGAPKARGLTANAQAESQYNSAATYKPFLLGSLLSST